MKHRLRAEGFVEFLNKSDLRGGFMLDGPKCPLARRVFNMPSKYSVVYDSMFGKRFIGRYANIWHSVGLIKSSNRINSVYLGDERMEIDIPRGIGLTGGDSIVPQRFILRRLFGDGKEAIGFLDIKGKRQLDYENGIWRFVD
jgi:hypothetical protein